VRHDEIKEHAAEVIRRALPLDYVAELESRVPQARKRRDLERDFGLDGSEAPDGCWHAKEKAG
jgi:hypothetical protein